MTLKINQESMLAIFLFGLNKMFGGNLATKSGLCDGHVMTQVNSESKSLIINAIVI